MADTLGVVLKHASDHERAVRELRLRLMAALRGPARPAHRLPRGAAVGRAAGVARRGPRRGRGAAVAALGRAGDGAGRVRRDAGQAAVAAADLRRALRPLLPAAGRVGGRRPRTGRPARRPVRDGAEALRGFRDELLEALGDGDDAELQRLAVEAVGRFGAMPGRGPGCRLVGVHRAAAGLARRAGRAARRRAARRGRATTRRPGGSPAAGSAPSPRWSRATPAAGSRRRRGPTTSPTSRSGRRSTGSTSPPPARPTSRRCAARSTRSPGGSRPG